MYDIVNLAEKFSSFDDPWHPRIVGELNGQHVKITKMKGMFLWHHHDEEDEMFLVLKGHVTIHLRDGEINLEPGEFAIIPRGVEHCPEATVETEAMLFEPASTVNTGNVRDHRTRELLEWG